MTKTRKGVGSVTFPSIGPIRGQYVFLMSNSRNVCMLSINYSYESLILLFS